MARVRISTTVDEELITAARELGIGATDSSMIEEALRALLAQHESARIDASYEVYEKIPLDTPDAWGDLESFRAAAGRS